MNADNEPRWLLPDDALLRGLADGNDAALTQLYRRFYPMVRHLVVSNSGDEDDARDIYQETLVVLFEKVQGGVLDLQCQVKTFIYAVSKRLWLKQLNRRGRFAPALTDELDDVAPDAVDDDLIDHAARDRQFDIMAESLGKLGEPCRTLLEDFYLRQMTMQAIAEKFGYTNADNAKTQKYKCLNRLKRLFFAMENEQTQ